MDKQTLFLVTDLYYQAKGREYFREDLELSSFLRNYFKVFLVHIADIDPQPNGALLLRNTGPRDSHRKELDTLLANPNLVVSNDLKGKGDLRGKRHLLELFDSGYPVIPTVKSLSELERLGSVERYLLKPVDGCDSVGLKVLPRTELEKLDVERFVVQPFMPFEFEVSFYFVDSRFHYALFAPDKSKRWEMSLYLPSSEEVSFAQRFIEWNTCRSGIQRVDACKMPDGKLLLMELEDYNPYLSLHLVPKETREAFLEDLCASIKRVMK